MAVKNIIKAIPLTTFNAAGLLVTYLPINPNGLDEPCIILRISNNSNIAVTISYDGITDHDYLLSNDLLQIEAQTNSLPKPKVCVFAKGTVIYVKSTGAGLGNISLSGYFQPQMGV